jgi:hypothetical protein
MVRKLPAYMTEILLGKGVKSNKQNKINLPGDTDDREADLSHPVHSDNCMIQPDGSCIPDAFAYVQRHYR